MKCCLDGELPTNEKRMLAVRFPYPAATYERCGAVSPVCVALVNMMGGDK